MILVALIIRGFAICHGRRSSDPARLVAFSPLLLWVGALGGVILSVPVTMLEPDDMSVGVWCLFEVFVLACIALLLAYCNKTIEYDASRFEVNDLFGRKRSYSYGEITGLSRRGGNAVLHCGRRKVRIDAMASGGADFVVYADGAVLRQNEKGIPYCKPGKEPMNGNLDTPWMYFFLYLLGLAASVMLIVISVSVLQPADSSIPNDAAEVCTVFSSYERTKEDGGTLLLHSPDFEKPFAISWLSGYEVPVPDTDRLCSGDAYIAAVDERKTEYFVYMIYSAEGEMILSAYDGNTAYRNTQRVPAIFLLGFGICFAVFVVFGILVGRYPERFPSWFCRLFYKDSAWAVSLERQAWEANDPEVRKWR